MKPSALLLSARARAVACLMIATALGTPAADQEPVRGPVWSGTIRGPGRDGVIANKGLAVTLGPDRDAYVCYDADLMRLSLVWTGEFLDFGNTLRRIEWPPPPKVRGDAVAGTPELPGWAKDGSFDDPRPGAQGPLPKDWAHFEGFYVHADTVVMEYTVQGVRVLERPDFRRIDGQALFSRTFQFDRAAKNQSVLLAGEIRGTTLQTDFHGDAGPFVVGLGNGKSLAVAGTGLPAGTRLIVDQDRLILQLRAVDAHRPFRITLSSDGKPAGFMALRESAPEDLRTLIRGGPAQWTETTETRGKLGADQSAYALDTLTEPANNPYQAATFFGGFDFLADGRAALCTFHGDVWIVDGLDADLSELQWRRFAAGMFQPLGLKVVDDRIYVLGRDQITRLHDLNGDGEADYYENFNNDTVVTPNYHEFCLDLHTDAEGNFYFAKGAPWEPSVTSPHQGCLLKVSKDGTRLDVVASGFRAPNGMTVGPGDAITVSDNQGHWMPASKLNWIKPGGFYGMLPAAQKSLTLRRGDETFRANPSLPADREQFHFKGWDGDSPLPESYEEPMCWLPMNMDNSSGGQVWVTSDRWGPLQDRLLFTSYGKCSLFEVMVDEVDGVHQGAMVRMPFRFFTGVMRARFNPRDGQLYVCGLKGWQSSAVRDGGFYRVRYTGKPVTMPIGFRAREDGIKLEFAVALDPAAAADAGGYSLERWNYRYSGNYGSPEFSVTDPERKGHDTLNVASARLLPDGKSVWLQVDDMRPADQYKLRYRIAAADGVSVADEVYATVRRLGRGLGEAD